MEQLLSRTQKFSPEAVAAVLRDQNGLNDRKIGLTNEKGINQLIAHHSVIFKPEECLVWVSTAPYQLGKYVCYDLKKVFEEAPGLTSNREIQEVSRTITADTFLMDKEYQNFLRFKQLKHYIQFCTKSEYRLKVDEKHITAFVQSNPNSYFTYWIIGDYYSKMKDHSRAREYYNTALTKEIATQKEADKIKELILGLNQSQKK